MWPRRSGVQLRKNANTWKKSVSVSRCSGLTYGVSFRPCLKAPSPRSLGIIVAAVALFQEIRLVLGKEYFWLQQPYFYGNRHALGPTGSKGSSLVFEEQPLLMATRDVRTGV